MGIKNFLQNISTGQDNETHDVARVLAIVAFLNALGLTIFDVVYRNVHFDIQAFGTGIGVLFAGLGAALFLKKDSEPK